MEHKGTCRATAKNHEAMAKEEARRISTPCTTKVKEKELEAATQEAKEERKQKGKLAEFKSRVTIVGRSATQPENAKKARAKEEPPTSNATTMGG